LALLGQVIPDLPSQVYRWRQVMTGALTHNELGPENEQTVAARRMGERREAVVTRDEVTPTGLRLLAGRCPGYDVELLIDNDGRIVRGKCNCSHHYKSGLRRGPCRHLQALRNVGLGATPPPSTLEKWFALYWN
jgi:hypothetical protein